MDELLEAQVALLRAVVGSDWDDEDGTLDEFLEGYDLDTQLYLLHGMAA